MIRKFTLVVAIAFAAPCAFSQTPPPMKLYPVPKGPAPGEKSKAAEVLSEFGLIGDFAADCSTPLGSPGHAVYTARPDGMVQSVSQLAQGPQGLSGGFARYMFLDAERVGPTEVKVRAFTNPLEGEVEVRFIKGDEGYRLVSSLQLGTGAYLIKDSQHRGYTYKWMTRCDKPLTG